MKRLSFNNNLYLKLQSKSIQERVQKFENKLYLEIGGKLFDDYHASRVLKGFEIDAKVKVLSKLKENVEVVIVISADDIQQSKIRSDVGLTYENDVLRLFDCFTSNSLYVSSVVITKYNHQKLADEFIKKLNNLNIKTYLHYSIPNYPYDVNAILSDDGFGRNDFIDTTKPIVVITAPGPGSGKMATCLSQLYNENKRGIKAGYAKFETFPVWNLPLTHPVNLAYEAATTNLNDVNMIDYYHLEAYGINAVNYNRDLDVFPILKQIFIQIYGESPYQSPTDMGVNMLGFAITNENNTVITSKDEIIRRYLDAKCSVKKGKLSQTCIDKLLIIMNNLSISVADRKCVTACLEKAKEKKVHCVAIELTNGKIITGKKSELLDATSAAIINCLKYYAKINDNLALLSTSIIEPIQFLKKDYLHKNDLSLTLDDVLLALAITAKTNDMAKQAFTQLPKLEGAQLHSSVMLHHEEKKTLNKLKINVTTETEQDRILV